MNFPDVKIPTVKLNATISYELEADSQEQLETAKQDFESAIDQLRFQGSAKVKWND